MRMTEEQLREFQRRTDGYRKNGKIRTHTLDGAGVRGMGGVDIEKIHRNPKYGNRKTLVDGITFHSKREAGRYQLLRLREEAKEISDLKHQVRFDLHVRGVRVCAYVADFTYLEHRRMIVEDSKGVRTPEYIIKKKLMKAIHGIEVLET